MLVAGWRDKVSHIDYKLIVADVTQSVLRSLDEKHLGMPNVAAAGVKALTEQDFKEEVFSSALDYLSQLRGQGSAASPRRAWPGAFLPKSMLTAGEVDDPTKGGPSHSHPDGNDYIPARLGDGNSEHHPDRVTLPPPSAPTEGGAELGLDLELPGLPESWLLDSDEASMWNIFQEELETVQTFINDEDDDKEEFVDQGEGKSRAI